MIIKLQRHLKTAHSETATEYKCPDCSYSTKFKHHFVRHCASTHKSPKKCDLCPAAFPSKARLQGHKERVHKGKRDAEGNRIYEKPRRVELPPEDPVDFDSNIAFEGEEHVMRGVGELYFKNWHDIRTRYLKKCPVQHRYFYRLKEGQF